MILRAARWMFSGQAESPDSVRTIGWWEFRRIPFNLIIGCYGVLCLALFYRAILGSGHLAPGEDAVEPMALIVAPLVINVLYTFGWILEILVRALRPNLSSRFGPTLLKLGLLLGIIFISIPAAYWIGFRLIH